MMKQKILVAVFCFSSLVAFAQMRSSEKMLTVADAHKMYAARKTSPALSQEAMLGIIKTTNKGSTAPQTKPSGPPQTWDFSVTQLENNGGDIYFQGPDMVYSGMARFAKDPQSALYFNVMCNAPGYYMVQIDGDFLYDGNPVVSVMRMATTSTGPPNTIETTVSMQAKQLAETKIVFGMNFVKGQNDIKIYCANAQWDFTSMHISGLK